MVAGPVRGDASPDALAKARAALAKGDGIAAQVPLQQALRQGVQGDVVRAALGEALLLESDRRKAREVLYGGDFAPESAARGWQMRGRLELAEGRLIEAGQAFDQSYRINAENASLWTDIGRLR
ncbi:MAG: hypothetical protein B7Y74_12130, partial [Novosphingobium sp. 35-62-5]